MSIWKIATERQIEIKARSAHEHFKSGNVKKGVIDTITAIGLTAVRLASEIVKR